MMPDWPCCLHSFDFRAVAKDFSGGSVYPGAPPVTERQRYRYDWRGEHRCELQDGWWPVIHRVWTSRNDGEGDPGIAVQVIWGYAVLDGFLDPTGPMIPINRVGVANLQAPSLNPLQWSVVQSSADGWPVPMYQGSPMSFYAQSLNNLVNETTAGAGADLRLGVTWSWRRVGERGL